MICVHPDSGKYHDPPNIRACIQSTEGVNQQQLAETKTHCHLGWELNQKGAAMSNLSYRRSLSATYLLPKGRMSQQNEWTICSGFINGLVWGKIDRTTPCLTGKNDGFRLRFSLERLRWNYSKNFWRSLLFCLESSPAQSPGQQAHSDGRTVPCWLFHQFRVTKMRWRCKLHFLNGVLYIYKLIYIYIYM